MTPLRRFRVGEREIIAPSAIEALWQVEPDLLVYEMRDAGSFRYIADTRDGERTVERLDSGYWNDLHLDAKRMQCGACGYTVARTSRAAIVRHEASCAGLRAAR